MSDVNANNEVAALLHDAQALLGYLDDLGIAYDLHEHEPIFTVAEGEHLKENIRGLHCRNLFLRDRKKQMFLVVAANETAVYHPMENHYTIGLKPADLVKFIESCGHTAYIVDLKHAAPD